MLECNFWRNFRIQRQRVKTDAQHKEQLIDQYVTNGTQLAGILMVITQFVLMVLNIEKTFVDFFQN